MYDFLYVGYIAFKEISPNQTRFFPLIEIDG